MVRPLTARVAAPYRHANPNGLTIMPGGSSPLLCDSEDT